MVAQRYDITANMTVYEMHRSIGDMQQYKHHIKFKWFSKAMQYANVKTNQSTTTEAQVYHNINKPKCPDQQQQIQL